jgi:hypothetical protein
MMSRSPRQRVHAHQYAWVALQGLCIVRGVCFRKYVILLARRKQCRDRWMTASTAKALILLNPKALRPHRTRLCALPLHRGYAKSHDSILAASHHQHRAQPKHLFPKIDTRLTLKQWEPRFRNNKNRSDQVEPSGCKRRLLFLGRKVRPEAADTSPYFSHRSPCSPEFLR